MTGRAEIFVATLGAEPQVITLALDALLQSGHTLQQILVLHTHPSHISIQSALNSLEREFREYGPYQLFEARYRQFASHDNQPISDITTPDEAIDAFRTLYRNILELKQQGYRIHLCTAGGRKAMAMYGMLTAQLLFDESDRLWLLLSIEAFRLKRELHAHAGEASLLRIPVIPWRKSLLECRSFISQELTQAEREVLRLLVGEGLSNDEIGSRRYTSRRTVETQLENVRQKAEARLGLENVDRQTLIAEFAPYFMIEDSLGDLIGK